MTSRAVIPPSKAFVRINTEEGEESRTVERDIWTVLRLEDLERDLGTENSVLEPFWLEHAKRGGYGGSLEEVMVDISVMSKIADLEQALITNAGAGVVTLVNLEAAVEKGWGDLLGSAALDGRVCKELEKAPQCMQHCR